jgi:excisionase family DNA binding protein
MTRSKAPPPRRRRCSTRSSRVVSERTVHRWIKNGKSVAHVFGGAVRIAETDHKAFVGTHRQV